MVLQYVHTTSTHHGLDFKRVCSIWKASETIPLKDQVLVKDFVKALLRCLRTTADRSTMPKVLLQVANQEMDALAAQLLENVLLQRYKQSLRFSKLRTQLQDTTDLDLASPCKPRVVASFDPFLCPDVAKPLSMRQMNKPVSAKKKARRGIKPRRLSDPKICRSKDTSASAQKRAKTTLLMEFDPLA